MPWNTTLGGWMPGPAFDEMWGGEEGDGVRPPYEEVASWLENTPHDELLQRQDAAETIFRKLGITFAVYGDDAAEERIIPFDIVPRVISSDRSEEHTSEPQSLMRNSY